MLSWTSFLSVAGVMLKKVYDSTKIHIFVAKLNTLINMCTWVCVCVCERERERERQGERERERERA